MLLFTRIGKALIGVICIVCLLIVWSHYSPTQPTISATDLALDMKLWSIYTKVHKVRLDVEDTIKHKKLTPEEAELVFQRNKDTLDSLTQELKEIKNLTEQGYSAQVQELINAVDTAISIAQQTYLEKHLADFQGAKEVWQTLQKLNREIPRQRTRHLVQKGCPTQQIYELFRQSGISEQDIQEYILQARAEEQRDNSPTTLDPAGNNEEKP